MIRFKGGTAVSAAGLEKRDIYVEGGRIVPPGRADRVIDVSGRLLFPGFIDAHTHMDMPVSGTVTADSFPSGTAAAVAGGTTVILDFATQDRGRTLAEALDVWHTRADGRCFCDYGFHMAVTDWNDVTRREMNAMAEAGITSFKGYMAYDALKLNDDDMRRFLAAAGDLGGLVGCHCELGDLVTEKSTALLAAGKTGPEYHPVSRPNAVEAAAVRRFLELAKEVNGRPWIVHLSTREGLAEIDASGVTQSVNYKGNTIELTLKYDKAYKEDDVEAFAKAFEENESIYEAACNQAIANIKKSTELEKIKVKISVVNGDSSEIWSKTYKGE